MVGRIPILDVAPVIDGGRLSPKSTVGEQIPITATIFREGHDKLAAEVLLVDPQGNEHDPLPMAKENLGHPDDPDRHIARFTPDRPGRWRFTIRSWSDPWATWRHAADIKIPAAIDTELMFTEGRLILERVDLSAASSTQRATVATAISTAGDTTTPTSTRLQTLQSAELAAVLAQFPVRELVTTQGPFPLFVDRSRALFSSWYEFFPRSEGAVLDGDGTLTSGTFATAAKRLDAVAAMGFTVIYLPPIHPIGRINRKGPNNTLTPGPEDPGSPWAIGAEEGGHDTVHPDLGTLADFDAFVNRARELGLEVALDLALQAAPDHPWVKEHPEWFTTLADGTIAYAENPPKKYQDIYPINFDNDPTGICREVLRVVKHWMSHGVRIFRVDNPHTKPLPFWEWLLGEVRRTDPDVLFLAEAFTRPAMMHALGAIGFHQSYTYFTWRTAKREIEDYLREVSSESDEVMRPNFFVNTPDILHESLQYGGPAMFRLRAVLAATGSPSWGVYAGYELMEHVAVKPGSEEYLDSEKYQIKVRDWAAAEASGRTLTPYLTRLNQIRRDHPALQQLRNLTVHQTDDDQIIAFSKASADGTDQVIVVINLDPHSTRETVVHLDLPALGLAWDDHFQVIDELTGATWNWGAHNFVRLDPASESSHILSVRRAH